MIVRQLDANGDWTHGHGLNNYVRAGDAVGQNVATRVRQVLNDCFWAITDGVDWFNLLGQKDDTALNLAIAAAILNTNGVTKLVTLSVVRDTARKATVTYQVETIYSVTPVPGATQFSF
jgi:hypothetical protein